MPAMFGAISRRAALVTLPIGSFRTTRSTAARSIHTSPTSKPRPLHHGVRRPPVRRTLMRRALSTLSASDVAAALPTMEDLGLRNGDHVTVAMSGGVDSATTLRILTELPIDIDVIFMKNWDPLLSESSTASTPSGYSLSYSSSSSLASSPSSSGGSDSPCSWEKDWNDVRSVSRAIGISTDKVKMVDLSKEYWNRVFEPSINVWERGGTPNPDVDCNREIKFGALLDVLPNRPRHFLATGHYGRIDRPGHSTDRDLNQPQARLVRAKDSNKDQTYYLSQMNDVQLSRTILPLGRLTKTEVRQLATHWNLPNHSKEESMGVCFIGERGRFGDFIAQYTTPPEIQGRLVLPSGEVVGTHDGLWYYTIGQRAKIANQPKPLFVAKKGVGENGQDILVVPGSDHPLLSCSAVLTDAFHWIHGTYPADLLENDTEGRINVRVRHRMKPVPATIMLSPGKGAQGGVRISFSEPLNGVAPGQVAAVWYDDWCLGSGVIRDTTVG